MRKKPPVGECHICGSVEKLSFEHVPPRSAFNNKRAIVAKWGDDLLHLGPDEHVKGAFQQGGIGYHSLCEHCNTVTGHWYGNQFIAWCYQGMDVLIQTGGKPTLIYLHYLLPLSILKQIVTMFFSVNPPGFRKKHPELVEFVLNREKKYLSPRYRFFTYYNTTGKFRYAGITGHMSIPNDFQSSPNITLMSEIGYTPFGYLMTIDSGPPDKRLFEITHFSEYGYNDFKVMMLRLPVLPTLLFYPGDYRTKEEIADQAGRHGKITL